LFSPKDLQLACEIESLKKIGITSLKIEGRMRSSEYVYNVVKAYRLLIDADDSNIESAIKEAAGYLNSDWARPKTTCFFSGRKEEMFNPAKSQCLGMRIGTVSTAGSTGSVTIKLDTPITEGDRIRITDPTEDRTVNIKITGFKQTGMMYTIDTGDPTHLFKPGMIVYKAGDAGWDEKKLTKEIDGIYKNYHSTDRTNNNKQYVYSNLISRQWITEEKSIGHTVWIKIDDPAWLDILPLTNKNVLPVLYLTRENMHEFKTVIDSGQYHADTFACELTPYMNERDLPDYDRIINSLAGSGINLWVLNNVSQFRFFADETIKVAGQFLYTLNAYAARVYKDLGTQYFITSWEDDFLNIKRIALAGVRSRMVVYLFGYPVVTRSRMVNPDYLSENDITSNTDDRFRISYESGSMILTTDRPVMNFTSRSKLSELGITNFGLDLCFIRPDKKKWAEIYTAYSNQENLTDTDKFNFKRGLK
jgi:putative protease